MTPVIITQTLTLSFLGLAFAMQIRNILKYGLKNGAGKTRMVLCAFLISSMIHAIRLMLGYGYGYFFLVSSFLFMVLYFRLEEIKNK